MEEKGDKIEVKGSRVIFSRLKEKKLITLMRQDNPDRKAIAAVSEISGLQQQMQGMIAMHILEMKAGLDKDQQKKFLDLTEIAMTEGRQMVCPLTEHN